MAIATGISEWNHVEILALVVAYLPGERFQARPAKWQAAVAEMKQRFPDLLSDVFFTRREPLPPYSSQVDEFLKMMAKSDHCSLSNPAFRVREISKASKADIRKRYGRRLRDQINEIQEMSRILERHVKLESQH